jgi:hypothetical protein
MTAIAMATPATAITAPVRALREPPAPIRNRDAIHADVFIMSANLANIYYLNKSSRPSTHQRDPDRAEMNWVAMILLLGNLLSMTSNIK